MLCTLGAKPQPQADSPAERSTYLPPCVTLQPLLTTHSPASGSFTCSEETQAEPLHPRCGLGWAGLGRRDRAGSRVWGPQPASGRTSARAHRGLGQPQALAHCPHLHGSRQPEEGSHKQVAKLPQPPRQAIARHGRRQPPPTACRRTAAEAARSPPRARPLGWLRPP